MNTYLFSWNPKLYPYHEIESDIQQLKVEGRCRLQWSCGNTKVIQPNDRFFLIKVGTEPKGIVAEGYINKIPYYDRHWSGEDRDALYIQADIEVLLNPEKEPILSLDILETGMLATQKWIQYRSGVLIQPKIADELEGIWFDFLATSQIRHSPFVPVDHQIQRTYTEGTSTLVMQTKYERNPYARKACINHYGLSCAVCSFNFEQMYGDLGKDFIHVHHLTSVAKVGKAYTVDPITDLRPVCANCHAMLHRRKEGVSIEELRTIVLAS